MTSCDYAHCQQYNNGKCMAPGYKECMRAKDTMLRPADAPNILYVFGKNNAKKTKEQFPNLIVMYRNARTKGFWVEYKGE